MLHHVAGKRHRQVITQTFLRRKSGFFTAVLDTEEQFVAFLSVLAHQRREVLHRRRLDLLKSVQTEDTFDGIEDIIAAGHFQLPEITRTFGYRGFLCHNL